MKIGYIRVSTQEQNTIRQEILMERLGVDELYIDRASGKNAQRPEPQKMMEYARRGDIVIVESISRFARNTRDLLELVERLTDKGNFESGSNSCTEGGCGRSIFCIKGRRWRLSWTACPQRRSSASGTECMRFGQRCLERGSICG